MTRPQRAVHNALRELGGEGSTYEVAHVAGMDAAPTARLLNALPTVDGLRCLRPARNRLWRLKSAER